MSDNTTRLQLPFLMPAQAQKHVTLNQSLLKLDALVHLSVVSATLAAQPGAPNDGDLYILPAGKTGAAWGAMTNLALAYFRDGVWEQLTPRDGWTVYVIDTDVSLVRVGAAWRQFTPAAQSRGFRNRLLNGAFAFNQRQATSVADDAYCFDRFYVLTETGNVTVGEIADPEAGRLNAIRLTQPDVSAKRIGLAQIVESADIRDLRSAAVAMAARIRCSAAQAVRMAILEWTGTADAVTSDIVANWASATYTPSNFFIAGVNVIATGATTPGAATWTDMTAISGTFGAAMNNAIVMVWTEAALAQNGTLDLDQIQLEAGKLCAPFARRPLQEEFNLCNRFYQKSFNQSVAPQQNTFLGADWIFPAIAAGAAPQLSCRLNYFVRMRAPATVTLFNPGATNGEVWNGDDGASCSGTGVIGNADRGFVVVCTGNATCSVGDKLRVQWSADAEL